MENTNKMKNLTNDLKAFEQMMKEQHKENHYPEIEFEIDTEEDSPADILLQASGMLMECSVMVAKAAFLVGPWRQKLRMTKKMRTSARTALTAVTAVPPTARWSWWPVPTVTIPS